MSLLPATLRDAWMDGADRLNRAGVDDARFEAEILLRHTSGRTRADLYANLTETVDPAAQLEFEAALARRARREPLAYIIGHREFYGLDLQITPDVLIPRPESELLVETALDALKGQRIHQALVVDVGTGSGALGIAIAKNRRGVRLVGIDQSRVALNVAATNGARLIPKTPRFWLQADLLTALAGPIDCIVANLPYISEEALEQLPPEIADFEPRQALVTPGGTGTDLILRLLTQLARRLAPRGVAVLEIDPHFADQISDAARQLLPDAKFDLLQDLGGDARALRVAAS